MSWFASLFPFLPPHVLALVSVLLLVFILVRWGDLIFAGYALWTWWSGAQVDAVCLLALAIFLAWLKACAMFGARLAGYRGPSV